MAPMRSIHPTHKPTNQLQLVYEHRARPQDFEKAIFSDWPSPRFGHLDTINFLANEVSSLFKYICSCLHEHGHDQPDFLLN
jgi:hypothetical protein